MAALTSDQGDTALEVEQGITDDVLVGRVAHIERIVRLWLMWKEKTQY
jgi:hypothetical protein